MSQEIEQNEERCATCRFALRVDESSWICRRYPPRTYPTGVSTDVDVWEKQERDTFGGEISGVVATDCEQPAVSPEDWCGEWQGKKAP